jgi:alcohol dehydrogenase
MALAASLAGWMLRYSHTNAGHSIAHVLTSFCQIPHGLACAYATPWVLEFNALAAPQKVKRLREPLGRPVDCAQRNSAAADKRRLRRNIVTKSR